MTEQDATVDQDPTMEEILQSIKRIIAEDDGDDEAPKDSESEPDDFQNVLDAVAEQMEEEEAKPSVNESAPEVEVSAEPEAETEQAIEEEEEVAAESESLQKDVVSETEAPQKEEPAALDDDIFELTDDMLVDDVESEVGDEPAPVETAGNDMLDDIDAMLDANIPEPNFDEEDDGLDFSLDEIEFSQEKTEEVPPVTEPEEEIEFDVELTGEDEPIVDELIAEPEEDRMAHEEVPADPVHKQDESDFLIEDEVAASASASIAKLMQAKARPQPMTGEMHTRAGTTVEELMVEAMKPMLKDWLNEHLPLVVEEIVKRELERLIP